MENTQKKMDVFIQQVDKIIALNTKNNFDYSVYSTIKPLLNQPTFFTSDYPFIVDFSGNLLVHSHKEGQRYPQELLNKMISNPNKQAFFDTKEFRNNREMNCRVYYRKAKSINAFIAIPVAHKEITQGLKITTLFFVLLFIVGSLLAIVIINWVLYPPLRTIKSIHSATASLATGEKTKPVLSTTYDEIGGIAQSLNLLIAGIEKMANFAREIGSGVFDSNFNPLGPQDELGTILIDLQSSLKTKSIEELKRKEEDDRRIWTNTGLAKFGDTLRQNNANLQLLSDSITQNLVTYLDANQGGLFLLNDDNQDDIHLELVSAFAFNRKKIKTKTIALGEGLVGNCAIEKHTVYLKEIPEDYIEITSGLGDAPPSSLLIVPLKLEDKVFGIVEIASFHEFLPHQIEFVEKIGENIASTLSSVKNSIRTNELLDQSQQQKEAMLAQEEEMRQNMEEMQATQEEMARKSLEMEGVTTAINESLLYGELDENGTFNIVNTNLQNSLGFSKQELEGKAIFEFIHSNDLLLFETAWDSVKAGTPFKGTVQWITRHQNEAFILCNLTPSVDEHGNLFKIFLMGQDITQSKLLELKTQQQAEEIEQNLQEIQFEQEILQQREENMQSLLQALDSTCLVAEVNPDGKITFINNKNVEILGDSKDDIEGKFHHEIDFQAKTNPEQYRAFWNDLLNGIPRQRDFSLLVQRKMVWISEFYTPIKDSTGSVYKIIIIGFDITQGKEIELRLTSHIEELKQMLKK